MALTTRLCGLLGVRHPILLAGMGRASTPELAAAVSNAGGLGVLGADQLQVGRPGPGAARRPGVEHHAAVDVQQRGGDDPYVAQQGPEHDGDAVGPDVRHVAVAPHEPSRRPLPQSAVDQR